MLHSFTPDAGSGDFTEVGGSGDVISGGSVMSVSENFSSNYGNSYRGLHASDEFKVSYAPVSRKMDMPPGWMRNFAGTWVCSSDEACRAEQFEAHNIQVDIDCDTRK